MPGKGRKGKNNNDEQNKDKNKRLDKIMGISKWDKVSTLNMAPCFSCPYQNHCGSDERDNDVDPGTCDLISDWAIWALSVDPAINYLNRYPAQQTDTLHTSDAKKRQQ